MSGSIDPASPPAALLNELDAVHLQVRRAFKTRDLDAYANALAPDLRYQAANGRIESRQSLLASVRKQFARLVAFDSHFDRASVELINGELVERGAQSAWIALRWFVFLAIRWHVRREGTYWWRRGMTGWELRAVVLQEEDITREGITLASRASLPPGKQ